MSYGTTLRAPRDTHRRFIQQNATDALVLCSTLDTRALLQPAGHEVALITSDLRLRHAARAEGVQTFNLEIDTNTQLHAYITGQTETAELL
jgi:hypothetical protein